MTHSDTSSNEADLASLLSRVQPPTTKPATTPADASTAASTKPTAASATTSTAAVGDTPNTTSTTSTTTSTSGKNGPVPTKRLLAWAVPLTLIATGAAVYHQSHAAGTALLLIAVASAVVYGLSKWLGKRKTAHTGAGPGKPNLRSSGPGRERRGLRGLLGKLNPFPKRPGTGSRLGMGVRPPAGGKPPGAGPGSAGTLNGRGLLGKLNPFNRRTTTGAGLGASPKPTPKTPPPGASKPPTAGNPASNRGGGFGAGLRNLLGSPTRSALSPTGKRPPANTRGNTTPPPGKGGNDGRGGGGGGGFLGGFLRPIRPMPGSARTLNTRNSRKEPSAANWRNSGDRWAQRMSMFGRRGYNTPRHPTTTGAATNATTGGTTTTQTPASPRSDTSGDTTGGVYRGRPHREHLATPPPASGSEPVDGDVVNDSPRTARFYPSERIDGGGALPPPPAGLSPATTREGNTMGDQHNSAHTATVLDAGAAEARRRASDKREVSIALAKEASKAADRGSLSDHQKQLFRESRKAAGDAGVYQSIGKAWSTAAAEFGSTKDQSAGTEAS